MNAIDRLMNKNQAEKMLASFSISIQGQLGRLPIDQFNKSQFLYKRGYTSLLLFTRVLDHCKDNVIKTICKTFTDRVIPSF